MKRQTWQSISSIITGMLLLTACGNREAISTEPEQSALSAQEEMVPVYRVSEEIWFDHNGGDSDEDVWDAALRFEYEYDANGNRTRQAVQDHTGNINTYEYQYAFATDGSKVKETYYNANGDAKKSVDYQYDLYGEMTECAYYIGNDHIVTQFYGANADRSAIADLPYQSASDSLDGMRYINYHNGIVTEFATAQYDADGNKTKEALYSADGALMYFYEYEYDAAGNMTCEAVYDADGVLLNTGQYEYRYDECGNVLEKTRYLNGKLIGLTKYSYVQIPVKKI